MLVEVKVRVCDKCQRVGVPTKSYTIADTDGREGETDRCADHADVFEEVLTSDGSSVEEPAPAQPPAAKKVVAKRPAKKVVAKKTTAKKTAAKKTSRSHSKTPEMTIEEINAAKVAGKA